MRDLRYLRSAGPYNYRALALKSPDLIETLGLTIIHVAHTVSGNLPRQGMLVTVGDAIPD